MTPSVSVIVANRGRAWSLSLTLQALKRQRHITPEIIVVSDAPAPRDLSVHWLRHDEANVATARNAGLMASTGQIVAFCDDDAVPEPSWLSQLVAGFDTDEIGAVGGPVLGPDGVREQWGEMGFDRRGRDTPDGPFRKLNGTNMALRREAIMEIRGFDPRFAYYLDETDMLLRLHDAGWQTRWIPGAVVHHATISNAIRGPGTTVAGFAQLGRSVAAFARSHSPDDNHAEDIVRDQRRRLLRLHDLGLLSGRGVAARLQALQASLKKAGAPTPERADIPSVVGPGAQRPDSIRVAIAPRILSRRTARRLARDLSLHGFEVTVITQTWLNRPLCVKWHLDGYFHHRGGVFRAGNRWPRWSAMLEREVARTAPLRDYTHLIVSNRRGDAFVLKLEQPAGTEISCKIDRKWQIVRKFDTTSAIDALQH
ncbi:glycosyltransferase family 2 protein [Pontivivens nitratireducens]|uniref:Glycosyltransferase n=1 Tax=Pontivivens nitratireducens TaxID=2758038 RepID=A0A6G7VJ95_9RHOB|nr:glycosyltransferase [Pontibrevibacter nitratireducens]QIK39867.1 glycosyltransferase [Pontibrevibacter nitratireducens]